MKHRWSGGAWRNRQTEEIIGGEACFWLSQGLFHTGQFPLGFGLAVATGPSRRVSCISYVGVGFKPTPTIAAAIAAHIIPADPGAYHHNRAIRKTEWTYKCEHKHLLGISQALFHSSSHRKNSTRIA